MNLINTKPHLLCQCSGWVKLRVVILIFMFLPFGGWPSDFQTFSVNFLTNKVTYLHPNK